MEANISIGDRIRSGGSCINDAGGSAIMVAEERKEPYKTPQQSDDGEVQGIDDDIANALEEEAKHNEHSKGIGNGNGNGKAEKPENEKEKRQIPTFKYSSRFRKPLHEAILLNDEPVFLMWSEENERLITVTNIEESNRILKTSRHRRISL